MASHHHHLDCDYRRHHTHRESSPHTAAYYTTSSPCFFPDSSPSCTQCSPPQPNLDHLLRLIASHLQNQQQTQPCCCETASVKRQRFVNQQNDAQRREYDNLLRKIDDLDLSLSRFSSSARRRESRYSTVKDSAARVIQTRFRSYLVRRSVSLRELKELTRIESSFVSLRSGKSHFPFEAVSREATRLLMRLDSIEGSSADSMIRDGKRRLCGELVRFLHHVDDCALRRRNVASKSKYAKDRSSEKLKKHIRRIYVSSNGDEEENIAELEEFRFVSDDGQEIPIVSVGKSRKLGAESVKGNKVKTPVYELTSSAEEDDGEEILMMSGDNGIGRSTRTRRGVVSFNENGNVYKVYGDTPEASGGDDGSTCGDGYSEVENIKYVPKENDGFQEKDEECLSENEEESSSSSSQGSKEEVQVSGNVSHAGRNKNKREVHLGKGSLMFSPPLPLKMEP